MFEEYEEIEFGRGVIQVIPAGTGYDKNKKENFEYGNGIKIAIAKVGTYRIPKSALMELKSLMNLPGFDDFVNDMKN